MYRFLLGTVALLSLTSSSLAQQLSPSQVKELLGKIQARHAAAPNRQADFREETTTHLMTKPIISSGKVWFERPNKFRREMKGRSPSITVSNGNDLWIYYPNFKLAEHYPLGKGSPADSVIAAISTALNIEDVEKTFRVNVSKVDNGYQMELLPRSASMKRMFQEFDLRLNNDFVVEHTEDLQPNGDRVVTTYTNHSQAPISKSTFEFTPPPGTEETNPLGR